MRRSWGAAGLAVGLVLLAAPAALATPPEVVHEETIVWGPEVDGLLSDLCGFEIVAEGVVRLRVTEFYDADGAPTRLDVQQHGSAAYSSDWGDSFENFSYKLLIDPGGGYSLVGNNWNAHSGAGGVLIHGSGRIVFDEFNEIVATYGVHEDVQFYEGDPSTIEDFCSALGPDPE